MTYGAEIRGRKKMCKACRRAGLPIEAGARVVG